MINLGMNVLLDWETPMGGDYKLYQPHPPKYQEKKFENHGYKKHLTQFWYILLQLSWNQMLNFNTYNCNYEIYIYIYIYIYNHGFQFFWKIIISLPKFW